VKWKGVVRPVGRARSVTRPRSLFFPIPLYDDNGNLPRGPLLVHLIRWVPSRDLRPEGAPLIALYVVGCNAEPPALLRDKRLWIRLEVHVPCGVPRLADVRRPDDGPFPSYERFERHVAHGTGLPPFCPQEDHPPPEGARSNPASAGGNEPTVRSPEEPCDGIEAEGATWHYNLSNTAWTITTRPSALLRRPAALICSSLSPITRV